MGSRLANFASWLRDVLPGPLDPWFGTRWSGLMIGSRYRVRSRLAASLVTLPLDTLSRRLPISLGPKTAIVIHAATGVDDAVVYAMLADGDAIELLAPPDRVGIQPRAYLLELPRRSLEAQCVRC
jgi:hypothetical protein